MHATVRWHFKAGLATRTGPRGLTCISRKVPFWLQTGQAKAMPNVTRCRRGEEGKLEAEQTCGHDKKGRNNAMSKADLQPSVQGLA